MRRSCLHSRAYPSFPDPSVFTPTRSRLTWFVSSSMHANRRGVTEIMRAVSIVVATEESMGTTESGVTASTTALANNHTELSACCASRK